MIAYIFKTRVSYELVIVARPCNGLEFQQGKRVDVSNKTKARAYCKANNIIPYNF